MRMTHLEPSKRTAALIMHTNLVARQVCMPAGGDHQKSNDGASRILGILGNYFAPEAADSIYQKVARLLHYPRMGHLMG